MPDGNILARILGSSVGLSSFWVLFSILLFGGFFGVLGMLVGTPLFAVIYSIIRDWVNARLRRKSLPVEAWRYDGAGELEAPPPEQPACNRTEPAGRKARAPAPTGPKQNGP